MKIKIGLILGVLIICNQTLQSKVSCRDTVIVILNKYEDFKIKTNNSFDEGFYLNDTIYYCKNRKAKKKGVSISEAQSNGSLFTCKDKSSYKYFLFYTKDWKLIAEGYWDVEGFQKQYKEYYKTGEIKEEGYRNGDSKVKGWKYYTEAGKLIKEEEYDEKGNLLSTKNQQAQESASSIHGPRRRLGCRKREDEAQKCV